MNNEHYLNFLDLSEQCVKDNKGDRRYALKYDDRVPFRDPDTTISRLTADLDSTIENLDERLSSFEKNFTNKHNTVYWASDYSDVFESLKKIMRSQKTKSVRLPNVQASTIFRELGIKYFLKEEKIDLREDGDLQFFAVDLMIVETGSLLLLNQTNNTLSKLNNSHTNIFFATIDSVINRTSWVEVYQHLNTYRQGGAVQDMVLFRGSPNCNNYLFIVDNQRSSLLANSKLRKSLTCMNCGRCSDVCPVLQTIGDEPYNNVFSGPVANIQLPYLESIETYKHVMFACTLCGRCESVCPIKLPIRDMIVSARQSLLADNGFERKDRRMMTVLRKYLLSRSKMNSSKFIKRHLLYKYLSSDIKRSRKIPQFDTTTFSRLYDRYTEGK